MRRPTRGHVWRIVTADETAEPAMRLPAWPGAWGRLGFYACVVRAGITRSRPALPRAVFLPVVIIHDASLLAWRPAGAHALLFYTCANARHPMICPFVSRTASSVI
jgi:hypothetical protein